jgi:hypothetical protein
MPSSALQGLNILQGQVTGTISKIAGDQIVPVARVKLTFSGELGKSVDVSTDPFGIYSASLPDDVYRIRVHWIGECSIVRRAAFKLASGDRLTFDFLLVPCPIVDTEKVEVQLEGLDNVSSTGPSERMDVPLDKQQPSYREQVIAAAPGQRPEIIVSFGKYDHAGDKITYFSLDHATTARSASGVAVPSLPLPVTITVDRYTIRAQTVELSQGAMAFRATGNVSFSNGKNTVLAKSAVLNFEGGAPKVKLGN